MPGIRFFFLVILGASDCVPFRADGLFHSFNEPNNYAGTDGETHPQFSVVSKHSTGCRLRLLVVEKSIQQIDELWIEWQ